MKKVRSFLLPSLLILVLFSCSNNENKSATEEPAAPSTSDLMKEEPAYDATKIDANAPVVNITLKAEGNTMTDMKYDQTELHAAAGSTVKIHFINEGTDAAMIHNFVLIEDGTADTVAHSAISAGPDKNYVPAMRQVLVSSKLLQPKESTDLEFPAPPTGTYEFICTYPGHYQKMRGKFIVD
jgi:azurin